MKVFYFITKSTAGGAQTHVMQLSRCLSRQGHQVCIMSRPGGWLEKEANRLGISFYPNNALNNSLNPFKLIRAGKTFLSVVNQVEPDLVSCHSTIAGLVGRFSVRKRIPTVFTAHGWGFAPSINPLRRAVVWMAEKITSRYASKIICVSEFDRTLAINSRLTNPHRLLTIHNGVESTNGHELIAKHSKLQLLFVGRYVPQKDPLLLLQTIAELDDQLRAGIHLTLAGGGLLQEHLERFVTRNQLESSVTVKGMIQRDQILSLLKRTDIFILTSNWEGLPRSILEAMSLGVPTIASDVGGVSEAVDDQTGILIPRGNAQELTQALKRLIEDPELRQYLGEHAKQKVGTKFSLEIMCHKTIQVYKDIL
jgi:glycosyltransferase involved in cell wall biosynthesis